MLSPEIANGVENPGKAGHGELGFEKAGTVNNDGERFGNAGAADGDGDIRGSGVPVFTVLGFLSVRACSPSIHSACPNIHLHR